MEQKENLTQKGFENVKEGVLDQLDGIEEALVEDILTENDTATCFVAADIESDCSAALLKECDQQFKIGEILIFGVIFNDVLDGYNKCYHLYYKINIVIALMSHKSRQIVSLLAGFLCEYWAAIIHW